MGRQVHRGRGGDAQDGRHCLQPAFSARGAGAGRDPGQRHRGRRHHRQRPHDPGHPRPSPGGGGSGGAGRGVHAPQRVWHLRRSVLQPAQPGRGGDQAQGARSLSGLQALLRGLRSAGWWGEDRGGEVSTAGAVRVPPHGAATGGPGRSATGLRALRRGARHPGLRDRRCGVQDQPAGRAGAAGGHGASPAVWDGLQVSGRLVAHHAA